MDLQELKSKLNIESDAPALQEETEPVEQIPEHLPNDSQATSAKKSQPEKRKMMNRTPLRKPLKKPAGKPVEEPAKKLVEKPMKAPAKKPAGKRPETHDQDTHKKVSVYVAAFFFLLIILADILLLFDHGRVFSENENRMLQQSPSLSASKLISGKFMSQFEDFVSDQFFLRDNWIQAKSKADMALGKKESNGVYIGKDGYLFESTAVPNEEALSRSIDAINLFTESNPSLPVVMTIVPNATAIYPERVPAGAPVRDQIKDIEQIRSQLSDNLQFIDLYDELAARSDEQLYYKSDHHWTSLGASYAFTKIAPAIGISDAAADYEVLTVADDFSGTMASASGSFTTTDNIEIFIAPNLPDYYVEYDGDPAKYPSIYHAEALENKDKYEVFFGGNYPKITITTTNTTDKNLLLIKDSYANCFVQFLLPYYDKIVIIDPRYYSDDLKKEIEAQNITNVLLLYNENTFVEDNSLSGVLSEPFTSPEQP